MRRQARWRHALVATGEEALAACAGPTAAPTAIVLMAIAAEMATRVRFNEELTDICFIPFLRAAFFAAPGRDYSRAVPIPEKCHSGFEVGGA